MTTQTVAIIGLGAMGSRVAHNLLAKGYSVIVHNRTVAKSAPLIEQGAILATSPRSAAEQSDVVISMVTDNDASRHIWLMAETGAIWGLTPDKIAIEMSTLTVDWVRELGTAIAQQGAGFLGAPVVGSRPQAEAQTLSMLVGGASDCLKQVRSLLQDVGTIAIHHIGSVGQGTAMKLAVNALFGIQVAALAELMGLLSKEGLSPGEVMDCLGALPVLSMAAKGAGQLMVAEKHAPLFPISMMEKDFRYVVQTAQQLQAMVLVSKSVLEVYQGAIAHGYGGENITGVVQCFV